MKNLFIAISAVAFSLTGTSQQDYQFSQYMSNLSYINPAYVGSKDHGSITGQFRKQWLNFEGAPSSGVLTYETPFTKKHMGIGGNLSYDKIGVSKQVNASVNYAYHLTFSKTKLSLGLNAGILHYSAQLSSLTIWDEQDLVFANDYSGKIIPQFGFGTYFYGENFYIGASIPRLANINTDTPVSININNAPSLQRHYYLMGGYDFSVSDDIVLKSSFLTKYTPSSPFQAEISVLAEHKKSVAIGVSLRTGDCISAILQYTIENSFRLGYSYDITISKMKGYEDGSHEILLAYFFNDNRKRKTGPKAMLE